MLAKQICKEKHNIMHIIPKLETMSLSLQWLCLLIDLEGSHCLINTSTNTEVSWWWNAEWLFPCRSWKTLSVQCHVYIVILHFKLAKKFLSLKSQTLLKNTSGSDSNVSIMLLFKINLIIKLPLTNVLSTAKPF